MFDAATLKSEHDWMGPTYPLGDISRPIWIW